MLPNDYGMSKEELYAETLRYAREVTRRDRRPDHYMATLLPNYNPATDCIFLLSRGRGGSAGFFCQFCKIRHEHGTWDDFEPGVPEGRCAHCDGRSDRPPQMTHYFIVRPFEQQNK
jgi:hypothetical protein